MDAYLGVAASSGPSKHRPTKARSSKKTRDAAADIAALAAVLERSGAGLDETKGDATGVSMTGGGGLTTVGGGTTAGAGAATGATAAGASTTAGGGTTVGKTRTDADAGGKTVTRTDADQCKGATTVGSDGKTPLNKEKRSDVDTESDYENWSLCGYEEYDEEFTECDLPVRIKESLLKPEERVRYQTLLTRIFSKDCAVDGRKIPFDPDDIYDVTHAVAPYFASEPMLIEDLPYDIVVVADIHGQLFDLERIFTHFEKDGKPGWECRKFLFLGDYVDRGRQQLEVVMGLFIIKMLFPDNIFMLRGNHEFVAVNVSNGFAREMHARYSDEETAKQLYYGINSVFCWMSIAAIIGGNGYFCAHAGVCPVGFTRDNLQSLAKPVYESDEDPLVHDLTWADPDEGLDGTFFNIDRHSSHFLGVETLITALESIDCQVLIRGHTIIQHGYQNQLNLVISLFSATDSANKNDAAVADIDATGSMGYVQVPFSPERSKFEAEAWDKEGRVVEDDVKTVAEGAGALPKVQ